MLTLEIHDRTLVQQVTELLQGRFEGDVDRMVAELLRLYGERLERMNFSGALQWPEDGLNYQRRVRNEW